MTKIEIELTLGQSRPCNPQGMWKGEGVVSTQKSLLRLAGVMWTIDAQQPQ